MIKTAIYCRLSSEDRNKIGQEDSESIQNQKSMLIDYALQQGWEIYKIYSDDDFSGTDAKRPEWNALIRDAQQGRFQIALAKTQSRFIRDIESMENILHNKFEQWGIRFISLVDQMDTQRAGNKKARQITGLMNDWYVEDLSDNLRATLKAKKKQGKFVGAFCCYGYKKDPGDKNKLVIDEEAAAVVRKIYEMYLKGMGNTVIARELNREGILPPTEYKRLNGSAFKRGEKRATVPSWRDSTVSLILRTQTYVGDMVQHKNTTVSYKNPKKIARPKEEWIIVQNTHKPIIDRETFNKVRELSKTRTRPQASGKRHMFAGKVRCGYCGCALIKNGTWGEHSYLRCKVAGSDEKKCEKGASIPYMMLYDIVLDELKKVIGKYTEEQTVCGMIEESNVQAERQQEILRERRRIETKIADLEKATSNLYIDKIKEIITQSQFVSISRQFEADKERLQSRLAKIEKQCAALSDRAKRGQDKNLEDRGQDRSLEDRGQDKNLADRGQEKGFIVKKYMDVTELTCDMVHEFIDYISIKNLGGKKGQMKREVSIYWDL